MPPSAAKTHWQQTPDRGNLWLIKLVVWIILHLGRRVGRVLLYPIVCYFLAFSSTTPHSRRYLARSLGRTPRLSDRFRHYYSFANMLLDRVYLIRGQTEAFNITLHGEAILEPLLQKQQGGVLLGSHLGNFDLLRAVAKHHPEVKIKALMQVEQAQKINQVFDALNPRMKEDVIAIGTPDAMLQVKEAIEAGYFVGILADRVAQESRTVQCDFLGQAAAFPSGPILVASLLKAPIILCFGVHRGGRDYDIYFKHFSEAVTFSRKTRTAEMQTMIQRYADEVAVYVKRYPYNWYNFYDFWDET